MVIGSIGVLIKNKLQDSLTQFIKLSKYWKTETHMISCRYLLKARTFMHFGCISGWCLIEPEGIEFSCSSWPGCRITQAKCDPFNFFWMQTSCKCKGKCPQQFVGSWWIAWINTDPLCIQISSLEQLLDQKPLEIVSKSQRTLILPPCSPQTSPSFKCQEPSWDPTTSTTAIQYPPHSKVLTSIGNSASHN